MGDAGMFSVQIFHVSSVSASVTCRLRLTLKHFKSLCNHRSPGDAGVSSNTAISGRQRNRTRGVKPPCMPTPRFT